MNPGAQNVVRWARAQQRQFLMRDLYTFAKHTVCPDITPQEHAEGCAFLEALLPRRRKMEWAQRHALFLAPRLTYKTSVIVALCLYAMLLDLEEIGRIDVRIVLGRATTTLAQVTLQGIKTALTSHPIITAAFGDLRAGFERWTEESITAAHRAGGLREPTIDTTGLNTSKTGAHPDIVLLDDLVHELNFDSPEQMESARVLVQAYYPILERWGTMVLSGTRWGDNETYGWILDQDERRVQSGGAARWDTFIVGAYNDDGTLRFPTVLPEARLADLRDVTEPKMFSAWYLNAARATNEDLFTLASVRYVDGEFSGGPFGEVRLAETLENTRYRLRFGPAVAVSPVVLVDPAPTVGPRSDFTGIAVVGFDAESNWWVLRALEIKASPTDRLELILELCRTYCPRILAVENADLDAPLLQDRLRGLSLPTQVKSFNPRLDRRRITADPNLAPRGRTKKAAQIEALEPALRAGRMFFLRGQVAPLVRQLVRYPYLDHDDVLDAFSMAKAYEGPAASAASADPEAIFEEIERRERMLEGLDERYRDILAPKRKKNNGAWVGLLS